MAYRTINQTGSLTTSFRNDPELQDVLTNICHGKHKKYIYALNIKMLYAKYKDSDAKISIFTGVAFIKFGFFGKTTTSHAVCIFSPEASSLFHNIT